MRSSPWIMVALCLGCGDVDMPPPTLASSHAAQVLEVPAQFDLATAVRRARAGDVVRIAAGQHMAGLTIEVDNLTLEGAGPATILIGTINVRRDGFALQDLTMRADGAAWGLHARGHAITARRLQIEGFSFGVGLFDSPGQSTLDACTIVGNQWGIYATDASVRLTNSVLANNTKAGFFSRAGVRAEIDHNTVVGNGFGTPGETSGGLVNGPNGVEVVRNNIVVGNHQGMNCQGCTASWSTNDVWGNVTDFVGDARAHPGRLSADPRFVNPAERDFRLRPDSPCIDAGGDFGLATDAAGAPRPAGGRPDLGAFEVQPATADLVITEVMANARVEATGEYVEIFNAGAAAIDLAGYFITDGDRRDPIVAFGGGTTLAPGDYALILDRGFADDHPIPPGTLRLTTDDNQIGNGLSTGDPVTLIAPDGNTAVSSYSAPFDPGDDRSAERVDLDGSAFQPSPCGKSPGAACGGDAPDAGGPLLLITEIMANARVEASGEYIELLNLGEDPLDLTGFVISDGDSEDPLQAFGATAIIPGRGGYALIVDPDYDGVYDLPAGVVLLTTDDRSIGNGIANDDPLTLRGPDGAVVATYSHPFDAGDGRSVELASLEGGDAAGNWITAPCGLSPARANCAWDDGGGPAPDALLEITEVMANPLDEDTGEFVEIYNPGEVAFDAATLILDDGDATDTLLGFDGGSTLIPPGGYAVILDPEYAGEYVIDPAAVLLRPDDTTIGSGLTTTDPVTLRVGPTVIARFDTPFNPGNGRSVERRDGAWLASACEAGSSPGRAGCDLPDAAPRPLIIINEVMANPLDEATGEFVELLNLGEAPVDVAGFVLDDGDAVDRLEGFEGGSTLIPAGGFAVILDRGYAGQYAIANQAGLLTVGDGRLGSGLGTADPVRLLLDDGVTELSRFAPPFNPGNGVSAERVAPDSAEFVAADCPGAQQASPGARNCAAGGGERALCRDRAECPPNSVCFGIPRDGSGDQGLCTDIRNRPGEGVSCAAMGECGAGLICAALSVFPNDAYCTADYHHGVFEVMNRRAIPDDGTPVDDEIVVFGLATVPLDIFVTLNIEHPAPAQLRVELTAPSGDAAFIFDGARDDPAALNGPIHARGIPGDGDVNGRWLLRIDDRTPGSAGALRAWELDIISRFD